MCLVSSKLFLYKAALRALLAALRVAGDGEVISG